MATSEERPEAAGAALAAWIREQPISRRARGALLRDLGLGPGDSQLAGLTPDAFALELHGPDGGRVARVAGIGDKSLAGLRRAIAPPAAAPLGAAAEISPAPQAAPEPAGGEDAAAALAAAAEGLLVPSETDSPLTPFRWDSAEPLTPAALLERLGLPPETPVETRTLDEFFGPLARAADWMDEGQRAQAARFAELRDQIAARLRDVAVYRVGRVKITALVVGRDAAGATLGLRTTLVET